MFQDLIVSNDSLKKKMKDLDELFNKNMNKPKPKIEEKKEEKKEENGQKESEAQDRKSVV